MGAWSSSLTKRARTRWLAHCELFCKGKDFLGSFPIDALVDEHSRSAGARLAGMPQTCRSGLRRRAQSSRAILLPNRAGLSRPAAGGHRIPAQDPLCPAHPRRAGYSAAQQMFCALQYRMTLYK
ncbi:hypothetical protein AMC87_PD00780 (plasmid) [Rhizobium phaseoli]|nr:hypothetical protein AMC87_PD00780 [Rhizobium phaseoli]